MIDEYAVCILFTPDLQHILLEQTAEKLDGINARIRRSEQETPSACARRAAFEAGKVTNIEHLSWLGGLSLPYEICLESTCTDHPRKTIQYFAGMLHDEKEIQPQKALELIPVHDLIHNCITDPTGYFITVEYAHLQKILEEERKKP